MKKKTKYWRELMAAKKNLEEKYQYVLFICSFTVIRQKPLIYFVVSSALLHVCWFTGWAHVDVKSFK